MQLMKILFIALLVPFVTFGHGGTINEGNEKMGKTKIWCFSTVFPYEKSITIETIEKTLANANLKRSARKKNFMIYRGATWPAMSHNKCDYYYKVKSKKGKTTVYLAVSKGYDNFVTTANDADISKNIKDYLDELGHKIVNAIAIKEKEAELKQIEKKNAEINKQLEQSKKEEAEKAKELQSLKKVQTAPAPVK